MHDKILFNGTNLEENANNETNDDDKELEKLFEETMKIPPISGDMVKDYVGILNKEMAALAAIWSEYKNIPETEKNPFIVNHMAAMIKMYEDLLKVADTFNDPKKLEEILEKASKAKTEEK